MIVLWKSKKQWNHYAISMNSGNKIPFNRSKKLTNDNLNRLKTDHPPRQLSCVSKILSTLYRHHHQNAPEVSHHCLSHLLDIPHPEHVQANLLVVQAAAAAMTIPFIDYTTLAGGSMI
jgi:hypothetical protein